MGRKPYEPPPVSTRLAPAPVASGISFRKLPPASVRSVGSCVEHWLSKCAGDYEHPAARWLFECCHEVKALLEPLRQEEARKATRLHHLEEMLSQWNEIFSGPTSGELASPAALAHALSEHKHIQKRLMADLMAQREALGAMERRCADLLAQHQRAHAAEREREAQRHAEEIARLRDLHASQLRQLSSRAPQYERPAEEAALAASRALQRAQMLAAGGQYAR